MSSALHPADLSDPGQLEHSWESLSVGARQVVFGLLQQLPLGCSPCRRWAVAAVSSIIAA